MPKETIQFARDDNNLARTGFLSATELTLSWSKGEDAPVRGFVQIGVTRHAFKPPKEPEPDALCSPVPIHEPHADHRNCGACIDAVEWQQAEKAKRPANQPEMFLGQTGRDSPPIGEFEPPTTVFTDELTRDQLNNFIRVLRRARDQAFGADA